MNTASQTKFSPTVFDRAPVREDDLSYMVNALQHGFCCSIVGPSNMGKSFLLQSLLKGEVRELCAQRGAKPPIMVQVDCHATAPTVPAFYESILRRIENELKVSGESSVAYEILRAGHEQVLGSTTDLVAHSAFGNTLRDLERRSDVYLVLILDEFDEIFSTLTHWAFRKYRVLTDELEGRLLSIVSTSRRLESMRPGPKTYEFRELFDQHTHVLQPLDSNDSHSLMTYLQEYRGVTIQENHVDLVIELSGGHPALMERISLAFMSMSIEPGTTTQPLSGELSVLSPIHRECQRLWSELESEDKDGLLILARGDELGATKQRQNLENAGLIRLCDHETLAIFSPVFQAFVQSEKLSQREAGRKGIWYGNRSPPCIKNWREKQNDNTVGE